MARNRRRDVRASAGRPAPSLLAAIGLTAALAACGSTGSSGGSAARSTATGPTQSGIAGPTQPRTAKRPAARRVRLAAGARIGAARSVNAHGTKLRVTVSRVIDPLRGSGATLLPATRVVGVFVRIANRGPGGYDSSSTGDISIIPSSGVAAPAYAPAGACKTPDRDFDNAIGPGESRTGCVVFTLDAKARLVGERFAADGGGAGSVTWRGPGR